MAGKRAPVDPPRGFAQVWNATATTRTVVASGVSATPNVRDGEEPAGLPYQVTSPSGTPKPASVKVRGAPG